MASKQQIRDAVKARIETVYDGEVVIAREHEADGDDITQFINCYIAEGEVSTDDEYVAWESSLVCVVNLGGNPGDDELDVIGDQIYSALLNEPTLGGVVVGIDPVSYAYGSNEQRKFSTLALHFSVAHD